MSIEIKAKPGSKYTRIEILDGPDGQGRYTHFRYWMADYHPGDPQGEYRRAERGQIFFALLPEEFRQEAQG